MVAPSQSAENGRTRNGRFAKGNAGGPGRPRGANFRTVVAAHAEATGLSIEDAICEIFEALLAQARNGDMQAAKLLLDRLCGKDTPDDRRDPGDDHRRLSAVERAARIRAILEAAERRRASEAADSARRRE